MNELYEWNEPVNKWSHRCIGDYIIWVKEAYGMEEAKKLFKYAQQYRAIKDLNASAKEDLVDRQPTTLITSAGMVAMAQKILNESFKEAYENHNDRL